MQAWAKVDGDNTFAVNWPLTRDSIVVEVGAYRGRWSSQIAERYGCKVFAYEPQPWAFDQLVTLSERYPNLIPFNHAIGLLDGSYPMGEWNTDACSFLHVGEREQGVGRMREATQVFAEILRHGKIDLVMMNIEGYEYKLVPYMLDMGICTVVERMCIQWHTFVEDAKVQHDVISEKFRDQGFELLWSFFPTLEAWGK